MGVFETFVIVSSGNIAFTWVIWKFSRNTTNLTLCHFQSPWRERNHLFKQWLEISLDFQHWDKGKSSTKKIIGTFAQVHRNNVNNTFNEVGNLTEKKTNFIQTFNSVCPGSWLFGHTCIGFFFHFGKIWFVNRQNYYFFVFGQGMEIEEMGN